MLLPSALSCDNGIPQTKIQQIQRPKLPSFERYDPRQRSQSPVIGLIASCRALHSILGERLTSTPPPSSDVASKLKLMTSPFGEPSPPPVRLPPPRGENKRRRDDFESDGENSTPGHQRNHQCYHNDVYSTPKRRRKAPLELPRGLAASDFESLANSTPTARKKSIELDIPTVVAPTVRRIPLSTLENMSEAARPILQPKTSVSHDTYVSDWSESDDKLLVETVLSKLSLSRRDWNDCAKQLGKDKHSLGQRWRVLFGGGNIGLRRGSGKMERTDLEIGSW